MIPDWFGIIGIFAPAILGVLAMIKLRKDPAKPLSGAERRESHPAVDLESLRPWLDKLSQLDIPDFEVLSVLKSRREQGVFAVRLANERDPRVLKFFIHAAGPATMLTAQREIFATYLLGDGPGCLHPVVARTRDRSATALIRDRLPGQTLLDFMVGRGRLLTLAEGNVLVRELSSATQELHNLGMIHCDIKPSNIVGEWRDAFEGRAATIRLIDFGMFAPIDSQAADRGPVAVEGTPNFTAPERLFFSTALRASDVYSCAVVTIFALTGQHQSGLDYLPAGVREVLSRASSRDATSRYATISEFADAWDAAFSVLSRSLDVNQVPVTLPSWESLVGGAGRSTILRSPLMRSAGIPEGPETAIDQELLEFRERNAEIIRRLGSMLESGSRDSARFDNLLRALEERLADSPSDFRAPPATSPDNERARRLHGSSPPRTI